MMHVLIWLGVFGSIAASAQSPRKIDVFNPERIYTAQQIREQNFESTAHLLQWVAKDFDASRQEWLAVLVNGAFRWRVEGTGKIYQKSRVDSVNRIHLYQIEAVVARFNPNFSDGSTHINYIGTIDVIIEPSPPPPPLNELELRLLALQKQERAPRVEVTPARRIGFWVGSLLERPSARLGAIVEVPLRRQWYVRGQLGFDGARRLDTREFFGLPFTGIEQLLSGELIAATKLHLTTRYPVIFLQSGAFLEVGQQRFLPEDPVLSLFDLTHTRTAGGWQAGVGMHFKNGFFLETSVSGHVHPIAPEMSVQATRTVALTIGYLFGKT